MKRAMGASSAPGSRTTRSTTSLSVRMPVGTFPSSTTIMEPMESSRIRPTAAPTVSLGPHATGCRRRMRASGDSIESVADSGMEGLFRCFARLAQRNDAALGEQWNHTEEYLAGDDRVAERGVAARHADAEARGNGLQLVL